MGNRPSGLVGKSGGMVHHDVRASVLEVARTNEHANGNASIVEGILDHGVGK